VEQFFLKTKTFSAYVEDPESWFASLAGR